MAQLRRVKSLWWAACKHLMPGAPLTVAWRRHRFLLFPDDATCRWWWLNDFGDFAEHQALADRLLREGDTVIDVGAHYGYVTTIFSAAVCGPDGTKGRVLAIEAAPHTVARLRKQIRAAGLTNVLVASGAAGACAEIRTMRVSFEGRQDYQSVVFNRRGVGLPPAQAAPPGYLVRDVFAEEILVQVDALDDIVAESGARAPCLIKLDIEGGELPALEGARRLLQSSDPPWLFVEVHKAAQEQNGFTCAQLLDRIREYAAPSPDGSPLLVFDAEAQQPTFVPLTFEQAHTLADKAEYYNLLVRPPRGKYAERRIQS